MKLRRKNPNLSQREKRAARMLGRGQIVAEVARKLNVVVCTVCEWEQKPKFQELMAEEAEKQLSILDAAADKIDKVTVESAEIPGREGSPDRRLYYQLRGKLTEKWKGEIDPLVIVRPGKGEKGESD